MADALKQAGNKHYAAKEYAKAVKKYTEALTKNPSDEDAAVILANRSASYTLLNQYDLGTSRSLERRWQREVMVGDKTDCLCAAVADAQHAAERRPRWPKAQVRLAEALSRKHAFFQAEAA